MKPYPYMPGVPAAGHICNGYWHPGAISGCAKCPASAPDSSASRERMRGQRSLVMVIDEAQDFPQPEENDEPAQP